MSNHYAQVSTEFTGADYTSPDVSLVLEQKPFPTDSGDILTMDEIASQNGWRFIRILDGGTAMSSDFDKITEVYYAQCGKNPDGSLTATIYAFKTPTNLTYKLVANGGTFAENPVTESIPKEESVTFRLEQSVDLGYQCDTIESIEWEGDVYSQSGSVVYPDTPTLDGSYLVTDQIVYGVCRVKYTVFGDTWSLNIPAKDDTEESKYQCTVFAFYGDNKVEELQVTPPNLSDLCNESVSVCLGADCEQPADDDDGDGTSTTLQLVAYDYCTGAAISDATFFLNGKQVPATGHTIKRGTTYSIVVKASGYKDSDTDDLSENDSFSV